MASRSTRLVHITTVPLTLRFFHGQIHYLQTHGYDVQIVSSGGTLLDEAAEREKVEVHAVAMSREIDPVRDVLSLVRLCRVLRQVRPDVVHSHTPKAALLGTIAARVTRVPAVAISIFGLPQMTRRGIAGRVLDGTAWVSCSLADAVWCDSQSIRTVVERRGLCSPRKLMVLGQGSVNGIDAEGEFSRDIHGPAVRAEIRRQCGIPIDAVVLGFVGRITRDKGMHELASAWRQLARQYPSLHLLLVGPFETADPLAPGDEQLFRTHDRVHLAGLQQRVAPYFAAMDVCVLPSYREGFGVTNIEASAMELPVVSTAIPGCVDSVVDGVTGTLVPARDVAALVRAVSAYCDDPGVRERHGRAGRARVLKDFRQEVIWSELDQLYRRILGGRRNELPESLASAEPREADAPEHS